MERKEPGDPLSLSASDWNSMIAAAEIVLGGKLNRRDNSLSVKRGNQDVLCRNSTGGDLDVFSIVGLTDTIEPTPTDNLLEFQQQNPIFEAVTPIVPDHIGHWGVLQEPLLDGAVGRVRIAGIGIAQISGSLGADSFPYFAECTDGVTASLEVVYRGQAQILWKDDATDWAIIRIGNAWRPHAIRGTLADGAEFEEATASDPHTCGAIVGVDAIWNGDDEVDVYNPMKIKLWEGCDVTAHWNVTEEQWEVIAATSDKVVHGIKRDDCQLKKLDGYMGWHEWDAGSELHFVKDVYIDTDACELIVKTCSNDEVAYPMDYVESVTLAGGELFYTKCSGDYLIADVGPCPTEPLCGTATFEVVETAGVLSWELVGEGECVSPCDIVEPADPPPPGSLVGSRITIDCA